MSAPDDTLRGLTGYNLTRATSVMQAMVGEVLRDFGLRRVTFSALSVVVDNPGLRQGQLADVLAIERSNIVQVIDELEAANLVVRKRASDDRRAYSLTATLPGQSLHLKALDALRSSDGALTAGLSQQQVTDLVTMLSKLERNAEDALDDGARKIPSP